MLLQLMDELNIQVKHAASTNGGEYSSSCPFCKNGSDRFRIWPKEDRYWCRRCDVKGDAIQFCRDVFGMDYRSACAKVGVETKKISFSLLNKPSQFAPRKSTLSSQIWQKRATDFVLGCHQTLMRDIAALQLLKSTRGLSVESMTSFSLGWNPRDLWLSSRSEWGIDEEFHSDGREKKFWLPAGIVIPTIVNGTVIKLKIRRNDVIEGDPLGKYIIIPGGASHASIFGERSHPIAVLVEAELDAMLVVQEAGNLCCCITLGGLAHPDELTHQLLLSKKLILFALDFDEAGKKAFRFWSSTYPNLRAWPVPREKSPCDAHQKGINLRTWIECGLQRYL